MSSNKNGAIEAAFNEVSSNPPKVLSSTLKKFGPDRMKRQRTAIALNKAHKAGAKLPNSRINTKAY